MSVPSAAIYRQTATSALDSAPSQRRLLYIYTYLASLVAIQILHLAMDDLTLNLGFTGGLTAGFLYSYFLETRLRAATIYVDSIVAASLAIYYFIKIRDDYAMYGNYLGILLGILMVLLAFKAFAPGDFRFLLIPSTICVMFSSVASYDLKFMLLLPLYLLFAGTALYLANQVDVAVRVAGTTGGELNMRFGINQRFLSELMRAVAGVILLSVTLYVVTPHSSQANRSLILNAAGRVEDDNQDVRTAESKDQRTNGSGQAEIGLGEDFNLARDGELSQNPEPVLRIKGSRNGYLRAQVFDVYTGSGWIQSARLNPAPGKRGMLIQPQAVALPYQPSDINTFSIPLVDFPSQRTEPKLMRQHSISVMPRNTYSTNDTADLSFEIIRQEITLLDKQPPFYFACLQPYRLENISVRTDDHLIDEPLEDLASTIRPRSLEKAHPKGFSYTVYSIETQTGSGKLSQVYVPGPDAIVKPYTQLPLATAPTAEELNRHGIKEEEYRPISQRLQNFAATVANGNRQLSEQASIWDKVEAIHRFLTNDEEFSYTRQYKQLNPQQEVTEAFVMGSKEGYCRYFASAMAVMCRLNGIAARVVTGYAPGSFSLVDNAYIVRASNAHAWVEVYFDEYGWVTFDPTPAGQDVATRGAVKEKLVNVIDFLQELFIVDPATTQKTIVAALATLWKLALEHWLHTLLGLAAGAAAVLALLAWRRIRRQRCRQTLVPENDVIGTYLAITTELCRIGQRPEPWDTARSYLREVAAQHPPIADSLAELSPLYEQAAFAPSTTGVEQGQLARDLLSRVKSYCTELLKQRKRR